MTVQVSWSSCKLCRNQSFFQTTQFLIYSSIYSVMVVAKFFYPLWKFHKHFKIFFFYLRVFFVLFFCSNLSSKIREIFYKMWKNDELWLRDVSRHKTIKFRSSCFANAVDKLIKYAERKNKLDGSWTLKKWNYSLKILPWYLMISL